MGRTLGTPSGSVPAWRRGVGLRRARLLRKRYLRSLMAVACFHMRNVGPLFSFSGSARDYTRFVILGRGRTGSTFLRGLLGSHRQILTFGELFRSFDRIGWDHPAHDRVLQGEKLKWLYQEQPCRFLEDRVFRSYRPHIRAVGFKLFYYHAQNDAQRQVWSYLRDRGNIKIIHITRDNTLRQLLSEKRAELTQRWVNNTGGQEQPVSLYLSYEECLSVFRREQEYKQRYHKFFEGNDLLELRYEALSNDYHETMQGVLDFLGVDRQPLTPSTYKQGTQPLANAITNYGELKRRFAGSRWERFFDE